MTEQNSTLIILSPGFPADENDSTCLPFPQLFVKTLKKNNPFLKIVVLAFQYPFIKSTYNFHGVQVIAFNGRNKGKLNRLLIWKKVLQQVNTIAKQENVLGILNFWLGECALVAKYAARRHRLKSLTWLLGQDARKGNRYFSLVKPAATGLIALSDFLAQEFYRNYKTLPAFIIPPGIDSNFSGETNLRDIDILGVGSLIPLKRYEVFIRVVSRLVCHNPALKILICGHGPEKQRLQKMIEDLRLSANIQLCGELPHQDVMSLMRRTKIFLHTSSYEGFATVYTEALAAGAQVVGFCQPMEVIFKNQHVVATEEQMFEKVNSLLNEKAMNHERVITCAIEKTCQQVLQVYRM